MEAKQCKAPRSIDSDLRGLRQGPLPQDLRRLLPLIHYQDNSLNLIRENREGHHLDQRATLHSVPNRSGQVVGERRRLRTRTPAMSPLGACRAAPPIVTG